MAETIEVLVTGGLPYGRRIRFEGVINNDLWPDLNSLEVRSELRVGKAYTTALIKDLRPYLTPVIEGSDLVVELNWTGADTRELVNGYFDIIVSDPGPEDARALRVGPFKVKVKSTTTGAG